MVEEKNPYSEEEKKARFKRVVERRVNRILKDIRLLGNTSNKSLYKYTKADVDRVFDEIELSLKTTRERFKSRNDHKEFKL